MTFNYRVSLQVWHPDADPRNLVAGIGLPPLRFWAVGDQRVTPKGTRLPGTYHESYCAFDLGERSDGDLAEFLRHTLSKLERAAPFIDELRQTGGKVTFFVSWSPGLPAGAERYLTLSFLPPWPVWASISA